MTQAQLTNKQESVWTAEWQDPSQENLRPCDDIFLTQTTSSSASHMFSCPLSRRSGCDQGYVLWDVRIIREARNKNRSEQSRQSNTRTPRGFHVRSLWWLPACRAQFTQTDLWPLTFPAEPRQTKASLISQMRQTSTPAGVSAAAMKSLKTKCLVAPLLFTFETGSSEKHVDTNSSLISW